MNILNLYTLDSLHNDNKVAFKNAAEHLNELRLTSDYDYEGIGFLFESTIECWTEKLNLMGFDVNSIEFENRYGFDAYINASLEFNNSGLTYTQKQNVRDTIFIPKDTPDETKQKIYNDAYAEAEKNLLLNNLLSEEDKELLDTLSSYFDYDIEFNVFDRHNKFTLELYKDNTAYEALEMIYEVDKTEELAKEFKLQFILAEEDISILFDDSDEIWKIEKQLLRSIEDSIEKKCKPAIENLTYELEKDLQSDEDYFNSLEYFFDNIDNQIHYFEEKLFNENGEFVCDLEDIEFEAFGYDAVYLDGNLYQMESKSA